MRRSIAMDFEKITDIIISKGAYIGFKRNTLGRV